MIRKFGDASKRLFTIQFFIGTIVGMAGFLAITEAKVRWGGEYTGRQVGSIQAEIDYFEKTQPSDVLRQLKEGYHATAESKERFARLDPQTMVAELKTVKDVAEFSESRPTPLPAAADEMIFELNAYPLVLYPEIEAIRAAKWSNRRLSNEEANLLDKRRRTAERKFHERLTAFIVETSAEYPTLARDAQVGFLNLLQIELHQRYAFGGNDPERGAEIQKLQAVVTGLN